MSRDYLASFAQIAILTTDTTVPTWLHQILGHNAHLVYFWSLESVLYHSISNTFNLFLASEKFQPYLYELQIKFPDAAVLSFSNEEKNIEEFETRLQQEIDLQKNKQILKNAQLQSKEKIDKIPKTL